VTPAPQSVLNPSQQLQQASLTQYVQPSNVAQVAPPQQTAMAGVQVASSNLVSVGATTVASGAVVTFDAEKDARELRDAIKGAGTDENTLIRILCHRPREHLDKVNFLFLRRYKQSLYRAVKHDTSLNFKKTLLHLLQPTEEVKAKRLYKAMKGLGTKDKSLIDVLAYSTNDEIRRIKYEYECFYGKPGDVYSKLEQDIKNDTSGNFERILRTLLRAERDETYALNLERVTQDAKLIYEKGEGRIGTDDSYFIEFFTKRSPWHIHAVNEEYKKQRGHDLITVIKKEASGDFKDALLACVTPKATWYAERLDYSMKGLGTRDSLLIFLLTSTTEVERMAIAAKYEEMFKKTLKATIVDDTSGDYQKALVSLVTFGAEAEALLKAPAKKS